MTILSFLSFRRVNILPESFFHNVLSEYYKLSFFPLFFSFIFISSGFQSQRGFFLFLSFVSDLYWTEAFDFCLYWCFYLLTFFLIPISSIFLCFYRSFFTFLSFGTVISSFFSLLLPVFVSLSFFQRHLQLFMCFP